jgi:hypothetical protein
MPGHFAANTLRLKPIKPGRFAPRRRSAFIRLNDIVRPLSREETGLRGVTQRCC